LSTANPVAQESGEMCPELQGRWLAGRLLSLRDMFDRPGRNAAILALLAGCAQPQPVAVSLAEELATLVDVDDHADEVDHRLFAFQPAAYLGDALDPDACWELARVADHACYQVTGDRGGECWTDSRFGWLGTLPRCVLRMQRLLLADADDRQPPELWAVDIDGQQFDGQAACGNGRLEPGELCDDGNLEEWDGCSAGCQPEGYGGCELIIFQEFLSADIAYVAEDRWTAAGTQLMVNATARPLAHLDLTTCSLASRAAAAACRRIGEEVPLAASCMQQTWPIDDDTCTIRFAIELTPGDDPSTFSATLPVLLGFTLRN
jgi:cysteine-rich repeat protein